MTALYIAGAALNFSPAQIEALVFFWDLPNKTPEEIRLILKNHLYLSDHLIEQFILTFSQAMTIQADKFDISFFCQQLWSEKNALEASALLLYFQQRYFTKPSIEESSTQLTEFTQSHSAEIRLLADTVFAMHAQRESPHASDLTLLFGGKATTCELYYRCFQLESVNHHLGKPYIFLSTRPLLSDKSDNPKNDNKFLYEGHETQTYHDYLIANYLPRYNEFLSRCFHDVAHPIVPVTVPTEGLVMFERYEHIFQTRFETAYDEQHIHAIYTGGQDAETFYYQALKQAMETQELHEGSIVALGSIQPYLSYYEALFNVVKNKLTKQYGEFLRTVRGIAYGPANEPSPAVIAQRLAAEIDIKYEDAASTLQKQFGFDNCAMIPKRCLRPNYVAKPFVFICSSAGDAELAQDTMLKLSQSGRVCTIVSLGEPTITQALMRFSERTANVSLLAHINHQAIVDCQVSDIVAYIHSCNFASAYIGLPSNDEDKMALEIALALNISVVFVNEFMFEPSSTHAIWRYRESLPSKPNILFTESLQSSRLFAAAPRRQIIGHRSLSNASSSQVMSATERLRVRTELAVLPEQSLVVVSGTTQKKGVDTTFLTTILEELPNHPTLQVRYSIHPHLKENMRDYVESLLMIARQKGVEGQFKIILNAAIIKKLDPDYFQQIELSSLVVCADISGPLAAEASDGFAQAVQGAMVNSLAKRRRPTFSPGNQPLLPETWFAANPRSFFHTVNSVNTVEQETLVPHTLAELGLSDENAPSDLLIRCMI